MAKSKSSKTIPRKEPKPAWTVYDLHRLAIDGVNAILKVASTWPVPDSKLRAAITELRDVAARADNLPDIVDPFRRSEPVRVAGTEGTSAHDAVLRVIRAAWQSMQVNVPEHALEKLPNGITRFHNYTRWRSPLDVDWDTDRDCFSTVRQQLDRKRRDLPQFDPASIESMLIAEAKIVRDATSTASRRQGRPLAEPGQPSDDRQDDIRATILLKGMPLTQEEIRKAMSMKTTGKLGHNLSWMVRHDKLTNIPNRGYWPFGQAVPR
jgi:hypothetical protein